MADIAQYSPATGRHIKEDGTLVNLANVHAHVPLEIARGNVQGAEIFTSFGELVTAGAVDSHIIWPQAGTPNMPVPDPAGVQMAIVSDSANDSSSGTGIRQVEIHYLDASLVDRAETVIMNGVTPVNMGATDVRHIQCMHMHAFGSGKTATGNITASNGGTVYSVIPTGNRRCSSSVRRVPAGKVAFVSALIGGASSGTSAAKCILRLVASEVENHKFDDDGVVFPHAGIAAQDSAVALSLAMPVPFTAGTIIGLEADSDKAATLTGGFIGWIEDA